MRCAPVLFAAALLLSASPWRLGAQYIDHRGHNVDSLERAVARWTPDLVDRAGEEDLADLNKAYRDLMHGYNVLNGEKSMYYARRALSISRPRGWHAANADAYRYLGMQHYGRGQYDSAIVYYKLSLASVDSMAAGSRSPSHPDGYDMKSLDDHYSSLYGSIGNLYNVMDSIPRAMEYYARAGEIFDKYGWNESNSILHYNIGETWVDEREFGKAGEAYRKALRYAEASGDSLMITDVYKGLGRLYLETGRTWKALPYLREAAAYYSAHPDDSPGFRTETLEFLTSVLDAQKRQMALLVAALVAVILLAAGAWAALRLLRRSRKEQSEAEEVIRETLEDLQQSPQAGAPGGGATPRAPQMSPREKDILDLLAKGYTTPQIAQGLDLSPETIKWYRKKLLVKWDVANTAELVARAGEAGAIG